MRVCGFSVAQNARSNAKASRIQQGLPATDRAKAAGRGLPGQPAGTPGSASDLTYLFTYSTCPVSLSHSHCLPRLLVSLSPLLSLQTQSPDGRNRFSHRRHLALKGLSCEDCHYSALSSRLAADDNLPKPETCVACHDGLHAMKHDEGEKAYVFKSPPEP